jgi:DNA-binding CsgD family transcriptional regulator
VKRLGLDGRTAAIAALAAGAFVALIGLEFASKGRWPTTTELLLEVLEIALLVAVTVGVALLTMTVRRQRDERRELLMDLDSARVEGAHWRGRAQAHLDGVAAAIGEEFKRWALTDAEAAVAWFVLKGLSHKEIATLRRTSEATVRQQAHVAYEKAGLKGRAAFCAYFLEDLLPTAGNGVDGHREPALPQRASLN